MVKRKLKPEELRAECDANKFSFDSTEELRELKGFINQERAIKGLELGISSEDKSFHVACILANTQSRTSALVQEIKRIASERLNRDKVMDWAYVFNFDDSQKPTLLSFPAGQAKKFSKTMECFRKKFIESLPKELNGEKTRTLEIGAFMKIYYELVEPFNARFKARKVEGIYYQFQWKPERGINPPAGNPSGIPRFDDEKNEAVFVEPKEQKKILENKIADLSEESRREFNSLSDDFEREMQLLFSEVFEKVSEAQKEIDSQITRSLFDDHSHRAGLHDYPSEYFDKFLFPLREFVENNLDFLLPRQQQGSFPVPQIDTSIFFDVNVVVDNSDIGDDVPVIYEDAPTLENLFGKISLTGHEHGNISHRNITCGSIQRANGGILIVPLLQLTKDFNPLQTWETLCRTLRNKKIAPHSLGGMRSNLFMLPSPPLDPEEMSVSTRVVLLVSQELDYIFSSAAMLRDGYGLFGVRSEFVRDAKRDEEREIEVARFLGNCARKENLPHCDKEAAAVLVEYDSRLAGDKERLSLVGFSELKSLFLEAAGYARLKDKHALLTTKEDVRRALEEKIYRSDAIAERISELIKDGVLKISVDGEAVGVINGLTVYSLPSGFSFGRPARVSATTRPGEGNIVNVEGDVKLGGTIQKKSVLIADGFMPIYLGADIPLSYEAKVVFEQSYSRIEGDSASLVEIYSILSSLADVPIKQSIAVTGSCNQLGEVQAIGGVNEKIEGFFDVCKVKGDLSGQAVIIPADNVRHLMLREDVVEAVKKGLFSVWSIGNVEDGIGILTGLNVDKFKKRVIEKLYSFNGKKRRKNTRKIRNWFRR